MLNLNNLRKSLPYFKQIFKNEISILNYRSKINKLGNTSSHGRGKLKNANSHNVSYDINNIRKNWKIHHKYYCKNPAMRCAIDRIIGDCNQHSYKIIDTTKFGKERTNTKLVKDVQKWFDSKKVKKTVIYTIGMYTLFQNALIEIDVNVFGQVIGLTPLSWQMVKPYEGRDGNIEYFRYETSKGSREIPYENCIHIIPPFPDPAHPNFGVPKSCSCMNVLRLSETHDDYLKALIKTGNQDGLIINFDPMKNPNRDNLDETFVNLDNKYSNYETAVTTLITEGADIHTSSRSRTTPFDDIPARVAREVAMVWQMPEKVVNQTKSGQYGSNTAVDDQGRLDKALLDYEMPVCNAITDIILHKWAGLNKLAYVPGSLAYINLEKSRSVSTAWRDDILTYEQYRAAIGLETSVDDPRVGLHRSEIIKNGDEVNENHSEGEEQRQRRDS